MNTKITLIAFIFIALIGGIAALTLIEGDSLFIFADQTDQKIEGFKYQVKISDGIATKDILR